MQYENKIELATCPSCSEKRPKDWFGPELKLKELDEKTGKVKCVIRYRKYINCWRCRAMRGARDLATVDRL